MRHSDFAIAVKATGEVVRSPAKNDLIVREKALPGKKLPQIDFDRDCCMKR